MRRIKIKKSILTIIISLVLATAGYIGWHHFYVRKSIAKKNDAINVNIARAKIMNIPITRETTGTLLSPKTITINPQLNGKIIRVFIYDGQKVKKGQPLFKLDDIKQKADLAAAKATQASKFDTYSRTQQLFQQDNDAVSKNALNNAKNDYLASKALVIQDKKIVAETKINAPVNGIVSVLPQNINVGSVVNATTNLVTLVTDASLKVSFALGEEDLSFAHRGQELITWPINNSAHRYKTTVSYISPDIDPVSRTFALRANISDPKHYLKPGLLMHIKQTLKATHKIIAVPGVAIVPDIAGYSVYTIKDGKALKRAVTIGQRYKQYIGIKRGLKSGESVIISRLDRLKEGSNVQGVSTS